MRGRTKSARPVAPISAITMPRAAIQPSVGLFTDNFARHGRRAAVVGSRQGKPHPRDGTRRNSLSPSRTDALAGCHRSLPQERLTPQSRRLR